MAAASAATVFRSVPAEARVSRSSGALRLRILSALVLLPLGIAVAWFGAPWLSIVTALAGAGMAWEWARLCRAGRVGWARLRTGGGGGGGPVRSTPIVLMPRRDMAVWTSVASGDSTQEILLSSRAQAVADALREQGALFFDELLDTTRLLRTELEDALGELVAAGRVSADSFAGLRALLLPAAKRDGGRHRRLRRHQFGGIEDAGRWALARTAAPGNGKTDPDAIEHIARTLLRRYGVVFWKLLEREAPWLPSWRELLRVYHRLEARGEIRGGRFVEGLVGEQFALPEAIAPLRAVRSRADDGELVCLSGCDPLNLVGTVLVGDKVPALAGSRVLYRDGMPIAALVGGKTVPLAELPVSELQQAKHALLLRTSAPSQARMAMR